VPKDVTEICEYEVSTIRLKGARVNKLKITATKSTVLQIRSLLKMKTPQKYDYFFPFTWVAAFWA
jgi:hypothetical protein